MNILFTTWPKHMIYMLWLFNMVYFKCIFSYLVKITWILHRYDTSERIRTNKKWSKCYLKKQTKKTEQLLSQEANVIKEILPFFCRTLKAVALKTTNLNKAISHQHFFSSILHFHVNFVYANGPTISELHIITPTSKQTHCPCKQKILRQPCPLNIRKQRQPFFKAACNVCKWGWES